LRATKPSDGFERVLVAGDPEVINEEKHQRDGIELDDVTWQTIVEAGKSVGVEYA
jgi:LDH2 family malate/lactate/ureidoglycolate dehydrogenase